MKYSCEVEINLPVNEVVVLFDNPDNLKHWQPGLISYELVSGKQGEEGAISKLKFQMGKREIDMSESITKRNYPNEFSAVYEAKGVYNAVTNRFIPIDENKTKYVTDQEFRFGGFMKLLGIFMPGAFKKETQKNLENFKQFAEMGNSA
jgi:carbon monoxide dehydrogenase subunit G